jgi:hypothetical protein
MENTLYIRHKETGANHAYQGRRYDKLKAEIKAGRGGDIVTRLVINGYDGFVGDDGELYDFEELSNHFANK